MFVKQNDCLRIDYDQNQKKTIVQKRNEELKRVDRRDSKKGIKMLLGYLNDSYCGKDS